MDVLKMPPQGGWKPSQNLSTVLTSIYLLMAEPNPDDALMPDITKEYRENRAVFLGKAKALTEKHAHCGAGSSKPPSGAKASAPPNAGDDEQHESSSEDDYDSDKENAGDETAAKRHKVEHGGAPASALASFATSAGAAT